jgi:hypothetical protein
MATKPFPRKMDPQWFDQVQDYRSGRPVQGQRRVPPLADNNGPEWRHLVPTQGTEGDTLHAYISRENYQKQIEPRIIPWETDYLMANKMERIIPHTVANDPRYYPIIDAMIVEARARQEQNRALGFHPHNVFGVGLSPEQLFGSEEPLVPRMQYAYVDNGKATDAGVPDTVATRPLDPRQPDNAVVERVGGEVRPPSQDWFDDTLENTEKMKQGVVFKLDEQKNGRLKDAHYVQKQVPPPGMAFDADATHRALDGTLFNHSYGKQYPVKRITEGNYWR